MKNSAARIKKIFVIDFDGTIIADESIAIDKNDDPTFEKAYKRMRNFNKDNLKKVFDYLYSQNHFIILGSKKCLWNKEYEACYFKKYGLKNTCSDYGKTTFSKYRAFMMQALDKYFGHERKYLLPKDLEAFNEFKWPDILRIKDKNAMISCLKNYIEKKFLQFSIIADEDIILVDDDERYLERFDKPYSFIYARPSCHDNSYLIEMLLHDVQLPAKKNYKTNFFTNLDLNFESFKKQTVCEELQKLQNRALSALENCKLIDQQFVMKYLLPLKSLKSTHHKTTFITDIEGDLRYFKNWIKNNRFIGLKKIGQEEKLIFLDTNTTFVFGGDATDRGGKDLAVLKLLVEFKERYKNRVTLLAGNRDINKIRLKHELNNKLIKKRLLALLEKGWENYFLPLKPNNTIRSFIKISIITDNFYPKDNKHEFSDAEYKKYINSTFTCEKKCQIIYLKWLLQETMGCGPKRKNPGAFELRRKELAYMSQIGPEKISDLDVLNSYLDSINNKNGLMRRFLTLAQINVLIDDTLFVHGAITGTNIQKIPGQQIIKKDLSAKDWLFQLNGWYERNVHQWLNSSAANNLSAYWNTELNQYTLRQNRSAVVCATWYNEDRLPIPISDKVKVFLNKSGIYRVVTGHQPFGDFPFIIRDNCKNNLEVISCDTSYSAIYNNCGAINSGKYVADERGGAVHEVMIIRNLLLNNSYVEIKGIRNNKNNYVIKLPYIGLNQVDGKKSFIGQSIMIKNSKNLETPFFVGLQSGNNLFVRTQNNNYVIEENTLSIGTNEKISTDISEKSQDSEGSLYKQKSI